MNFAMWLYSIKQLGETMAEAVEYFNDLPEERKKELQVEYEYSTQADE